MYVYARERTECIGPRNHGLGEAVTRVYRLTQGEDTMSGAERARRRDDIFSENK